MHLGRIRLPAVLHAGRHALAMGPSGLLRGGARVANLPVAAHGLHIGLVELLLVHLVRVRVRVRVRVSLSLHVGLVELLLMHPYEMEGHRGRLSEQLA
tara:strand:+ start:269 stop:562 length:294 start_codon:yes stop_codon:yes gene_type:complete